MKKYIQIAVLFTCIFFGSYSIEARSFNAKDNPNYSITKIPIDLIKGANAIVRDAKETFTVKSEGTATYEKHCVITILNENGKEFGRFQEYYDDFQSMGKITATLYDANGKVVRKLKKDEIVDVSATSWSNGYGDNRIVTAKMVYDDYPYTVEYHYTINQKGLMFYPSWRPQFAEKLAIQKSSFTVKIPYSMPNLRYYSEDETLKPKIANENPTKSYVWNVNDLKVIEVEPYGPSSSDQILSVLTAPTDFKIDGYAGNMETWQNYGKWYYELNEGRDKLSSETILKVRELIEGAESKREKVKRIYQYLQSHTRYVSIQLGIGGWQTFDAAYVEKNNYGDCKALTNYMQSMLKEMGISSKPVLVRAGRRVPKVCSEFCAVQFNHIFLTVPLESEKDTLWLECTSQENPLNYLGSFTDDRNVLLIDKEKSRMIRTPASTAKDNMRERNIEAEILESGGVSAKVAIRYKGLQQDYPRSIAKMASSREQEEWLQETIDLSGKTINEYEFTTVSQDEPLVVLEVDLDARQYASKAGKRLLINPNILSRMTHIPEKMEERTQPVQLKRAYSYKDEVHYTLPEGLSIESMPDAPVEIKSDFGTYQAQFLMSEDGKLQYTRFFHQNKVNLHDERYEDFREFMIEVNKADKTKVVLVRGE